MRTTIRIDDDLYRTVKERAARSGRTVADTLEDLIRIGLIRSGGNHGDLYRIGPTGSGGLRPGIDLTSNASVADACDERGWGDSLR